MLMCVTAPNQVTSDLSPPHADSAQHIMDDPQEWVSFSERVPVQAKNSGQNPEQGPERWCSYVSIEGMHCAACALNVESALLAVPGVDRAEVDAASKRARVTWQSSVVKPSVWFEAVRRAGYEAIPAHDPASRLKRQAQTRMVVWQWAVAGFCMMQVMMYAAPEYIDGGADIPWDSRQLLHWAGWVLSLPVLIFSCAPYWRSAWQDLKAKRVGMDLPVALGMAITMGVSTLATFEPQGWWGSTVYFDSFTMFVFFLLSGRWLTLRMRDRTAGALDEVLNRLPDVVQRLDAQGQWQAVGLRQLRVGDVVQVNPGERFPADGVLLGAVGAQASSQTWVEEALLTGESHPQWRQVGDRVLAGSHNLSQQVRMRITGLGSDTRHAQIVSLMNDAALEKPRMAQLADQWAKPFLWGVLLAALLALIYGAMQGASQAVMAAAAVLIVTCPCALSLATPSALIAAAGRMAKEGVLIRKLQVLESLAQLDTVVFDKTGTLTTGTMALQTVWCAGQAQPLSAAWAMDSLHLAPTTRDGLKLVGEVAQASAHPVSRALAQWALSRPASCDHAQAHEPAGAGVVQADPASCNSGFGFGLGPVVIERVTELPGQGLIAQLQIAGVVKTLRLGSLKHMQWGSDCAGLPLDAMQATVHVSLDDQWLMSVLLSEQVRSDAQAALHALRAMGLHIRVMSGDRPEPVQRVAAALGVAPEHALGQCTPADKLTQLKALQAQGHRLLMVGDGFNDMPVLAGADASMAFARAVALAQAHADVVTLGEQLMCVPKLIALAKKTMSVIRGSLIWALAYNVISIPLAVVGGLSPAVAGLGMAASSLWVVMRALPLNQSAPHTFPQSHRPTLEA